MGGRQASGRTTPCRKVMRAISLRPHVGRIPHAGIEWRHATFSIPPSFHGFRFGRAAPHQAGFLRGIAKIQSARPKSEIQPLSLSWSMARIPSTHSGQMNPTDVVHANHIDFAVTESLVNFGFEAEEVLLRPFGHRWVKIRFAFGFHADDITQGGVCRQSPTGAGETSGVNCNGVQCCKALLGVLGLEPTAFRLARECSLR